MRIKGQPTNSYKVKPMRGSKTNIDQYNYYKRSHFDVSSVNGEEAETRDLTVKMFLDIDKVLSIHEIDSIAQMSHTAEESK